MGNTPSKAPTSKRRRPTSFYGKKFKPKSDDSKTSRRRSLPATTPTREQEYNPLALPMYKSDLFSVFEDEHVIDEHSMHQVTWERNFMAPVEEILRRDGAEIKVLDVGCGSGRWTLEVAAEFPHAKFVGIDTTRTILSNIKSPNVEFQQANFLEKLKFGDETFDFVHCRSIHTKLTNEDWPTLINELVRVTKVGGYIELLEQDFVWLEEASISNIIKPKALQNINFKPSPHISRALHDNSDNNQVFHQVRQEKIGLWGGKAGKLRLQQHLSMIKDLKLQVLDSVGMTHEEYDQALDLITRELLDGKNYILAHRFWVKKRK